MGLLNLPDEIKIHIIDHFDQRPPPSVEWAGLDPVRQVFRLPFAHTPLKNLSSTCQAFRRLTRDVLLRHVRIDLDELVSSRARQHGSDEPLSFGKDPLVNPIPAWMTHSAGQQASRTLLVEGFNQSTCLHLTTTSKRDIHHFWQNILDAINPSHVTVHGEIWIIKVMLGCKPSEGAHMPWGFLPAALVSLTTKDIAQVPDMHDRDADHGFASRPDPSIEAQITRPSLLFERNWSKLHFNEGNSNSSHYGRTPSWERHGLSRGTLLETLLPRCCSQWQIEHSHRWAHLRDGMTFVDCLTYSSVGEPSGRFPAHLIGTRGISPLQFCRELRLRLASDQDDIDSDDMPEPERATMMQQQLSQAVESLSRVRAFLILKCAEPGWRLKKVVFEDDDAMTAHPGLKKEFKLRVLSHLGPGGPSLELRQAWSEWSRVTSVKSGAETGQPLLVLHD